MCAVSALLKGCQALCKVCEERMLRQIKHFCSEFPRSMSVCGQLLSVETIVMLATSHFHCNQTTFVACHILPNTWVVQTESTRTYRLTLFTGNPLMHAVMLVLPCTCMASTADAGSVLSTLNTFITQCAKTNVGSDSA